MKIRTRIFLVFAIMMAIGIFSLVRWMQGEMRPRYMEAQEDTLVDMSQMLASILSTEAVRETDQQITLDTDFLHTSFAELLQRKIDAQIYEINKQHVDIRVYVTDQSGKVIFDSDGNRDLHVDYSQWRDVYLTLRGEYGARSTDFDPLYPDGSIMYIAAPVNYKDEVIGVVSVGKPTRNAERFMEHLLGNISSVGLLILVIAVLVGMFIHNWLSRPLQRLQQYADAVTRAERTTLPELGNNEVGQVGQAMESMKIALDGKSYVSDYVQALTHELKSPIAAIQGASELLQEDMPAADRQRFLDNISSEVQRMQELVERLLELASLEYRPSLEKQDQINIRQLIGDVVASLRPVANAQGVIINQTANETLQVQGDNFLLSKALTNIVKNAIEFSPAEHVIDIHAEQHDQLLHVQVCDQGEGIPEYARDRVFERFFSLPRPDGRKGTGLGLNFVREIAALHQGKVVIESNPQTLSDKTTYAGTCVTLSLPTN